MTNNKDTSERELDDLMNELNKINRASNKAFMILVSGGSMKSVGEVLNEFKLEEKIQITERLLERLNDPRILNSRNKTLVSQRTKLIEKVRQISEVLRMDKMGEPLIARIPGAGNNGCRQGPLGSFKRPYQGI